MAAQTLAQSPGFQAADKPLSSIEVLVEVPPAKKPTSTGETSQISVVSLLQEIIAHNIPKETVNLILFISVTSCAYSAAKVAIFFNMQIRTLICKYGPFRLHFNNILVPLHICMQIITGKIWQR